MNPFQVVKDFEQALANYTGAPYCVTTTSCTMAILLAVAWHLRGSSRPEYDATDGTWSGHAIEIPKRTYVGVPMSIIHAGGRPTFRDEAWRGAYRLKPLPVYDSARWFTSGMYQEITWLDSQAKAPLADSLEHLMICLSFHWAKTLGIQQGGAILLDDEEAAMWLRRARFDGRIEGVAPKDQMGWQLGWHAYLSPETAAAGLVRLANLPQHNKPIPNDDYPDLSTFEIFK